jgi:hypothetical protein
MARTRIATALLGCLLSAASAGTVQADVVYSDFNGLNGTNNAVIDNFAVTSTGGNFIQKSLGGSFGVGVTGGSVWDEIDGIGSTAESISFVSNIGSRLLSSFSVSFLYASPAYGDAVNETASIIINGTSYILSVLNPLQATFTFAGAVVSNISAGSEGAGGEWRVTFASPINFSSIVFAPGPTGGPEAPLGDYAFGSLITAAVPGPVVGAGLPGLLMALGGLVMLARRRRNQAGVA